MFFEKKISSPIGKLTLLASEKGICAIGFSGDNLDKSFAKRIKSTHNSHLLKCENELKEYFEGKRKKFSVTLDLMGTDFQKKIWASLLKIPYGKIESYLEQATRVGNKKGVRAVAAANGRNRIAIIIPCHRVIASSGHLHGYGGGLETKRKLLELEGLKINQKLHINKKST